MNELDPNNYQWFTIPGYSSYDININTWEIRSNKHYKSDCHHIMAVKNGRVTITDDYGKSRRPLVYDLYVETFNKGNPLVFRANGWYHTGGMVRSNRNQKISLDFSNFVSASEPLLPKYMIKPFVITRDDNPKGH